MVGSTTPPPSHFKMVFDAAIAGKTAWLAAIYVNSMGSVIPAWTTSSSASDPLRGEAEAFELVIHNAKTLQLKTLLLYGDSMDVIDALLSNNPTGDQAVDNILH